MWTSSPGPTRTPLVDRNVHKPYSPRSPSSPVLPSSPSVAPFPNMASEVSPTTNSVVQLLPLSYTPFGTPGTVSTRDSESGFGIPADVPGCITFAQYLAIEAAFERGVSPSRRDKVLISSAFICRMVPVLAAPNDWNAIIPTMGPQLRHWIRSKFDLSPNGFVLQQGKPVLIREHMYRALCEAHLESSHGGRDRTSAAIRQRFSCVPKGLIARFVRACPTCFTRRMNTYGAEGLEALEAASTPLSPYLASSPMKPLYQDVDGQVNGSCSPGSPGSPLPASTGSGVIGAFPVTSRVSSLPLNGTYGDVPLPLSQYAVHPQVSSAKAGNVPFLGFIVPRRDSSASESDCSFSSDRGSSISCDTPPPCASLRRRGPAPPSVPSYPPPIFPSGPYAVHPYNVPILPPLRSLQLGPVDGLAGFPLVRENARPGYRLEDKSVELSPFAPQSPLVPRPLNPTPFEASFPSLPRPTLQRMHSADDLRMASLPKTPIRGQPASAGATPRFLGHCPPIYDEETAGPTKGDVDTSTLSSLVAALSASSSPAQTLGLSLQSPQVGDGSPQGARALPSSPAVSLLQGSKSLKAEDDESKLPTVVLSKPEGLALRITTADVFNNGIDATMPPLSASSALSPASAILSPMTPDASSQLQIPEAEVQKSIVSGWIPKYDVVVEEWLDMDYVDEMEGKDVGSRDDVVHKESDTRPEIA